MAISDQQRLYGQLLVDFANAGTTDEAGLKYFENVQKVFPFPSQFADIAKTNFPTLNGFHFSLNDSEMQCFELISEQKLIEKEILSAIDGTALRYDFNSKYFHVHTLPVVQLDDGSYEMYDEAEPVGRDISIDELEVMLRLNKKYPDSKKISEDILSFSLPRLLELGEILSELKEISGERYQQISDLEDIYTEVTSEHMHIEIIQKMLNEYLDNVVQNLPLQNIEIYDEIVSRYNDTQKSRINITNAGIEDESPFHESHFIDRTDISIHCLEKIYDSPIAYCFIEFLRGTESREHLKKCNLCEKFYIANKLLRNQKRCSICSKKTRLSKDEMAKYQRYYRSHIKKRKLSAERNTKIKQYMEDGYTRREAETLVKNSA